LIGYCYSPPTIIPTFIVGPHHTGATTCHSRLHEIPQEPFSILTFYTSRYHCSLFCCSATGIHGPLPFYYHRHDIVILHHRPTYARYPAAWTCIAAAVTCYRPIGYDDLRACHFSTPPYAPYTFCRLRRTLWITPPAFTLLPFYLITYCCCVTACPIPFTTTPAVLCGLLPLRSRAFLFCDRTADSTILHVTWATPLYGCCYVRRKAVTTLTLLPLPPLNTGSTAFLLVITVGSTRLHGHRRSFDYDYHRACITTAFTFVTRLLHFITWAFIPPPFLVHYVRLYRRWGYVYFLWIFLPYTCSGSRLWNYLRPFYRNVDCYIYLPTVLFHYTIGVYYHSPYIRPHSLDGISVDSFVVHSVDTTYLLPFDLPILDHFLRLRLPTITTT